MAWTPPTEANTAWYKVTPDVSGASTPSETQSSFQQVSKPYSNSTPVLETSCPWSEPTEQGYWENNANHILLQDYTVLLCADNQPFDLERKPWDLAVDTTIETWANAYQS